MKWKTLKFNIDVVDNALEAFEFDFVAAVADGKLMMVHDYLDSLVLYCQLV